MTKPAHKPDLDQQAVAASEERLRALVTATSDVIYSLSADWEVMRQLDGRGFLKDTHEPITGWQTRNIYTDDLEKVTTAIQEAIKEKKIFQMEHRVWRADGTPGWTFSRAVPILDAKGDIIEWFGVASDITERKQAEDALQQQRRLYETITSSTPDLMYVFDLNYRFTYANSALLSMWGKTWDNAIGKSLLENGYEPWHAEMHEREIDQVKATRRPIRGEVSFPHATLGRRVYDYIFTPVFGKNGEVEAVAGTTRDVTERQQLLNSVKDSEAKLDQVINQLPVSITVLMGEDFVIERTNPSNLAYWQKSAAAVVGKPLLEALPELVDQAFPGQLKQVLDTGETIFEEEHPVKLEAPDGSFHTTYVDYSYQPLADKDGKRVGVLVMSNDVTEKVESRRLLEKYAADLQDINAEAAAANEELAATNEQLSAMQLTLENSLRELADSEANFRSVIIQSPVAMGLFKGMEMRLEVINDRFLELWGRDSTIIGKTLLEALPELKDQPYPRIMQEVYQSGETYYGSEAEVYLTRGGLLEKGYYNFINHPFLADDGTVKGIIVVAIEVTEQVRARHLLQQAEEMLRMAIEAARIGSWYIEPQTKALQYNPMLARIFGYEGETAMTYEQAIAQVGEEFRPMLLKKIESAIATGEHYDVTYTHRRFNDGEVIWLRSIGRISADDQGNYTIFSGVVMDITEQKADEQRKNDFIGMVSHELKTPLTSLTAIVQVANAKLKNNPDSFLSGAMGKAQVQVKRMTQMINGFLNVSRLESGKMLISKEQFNLDEMLEEMIKEAELTATGMAFHFDACGPVAVKADRDKIASVVINLLSNAVKYAPNSKIIDIKCTIKEGMAVVSVQDYGMGVKRRDREKLFDRYYRVESDHMQHIAGFGIGLYLSAEIVHRHNGSIWVESEYGFGSTFYFSLPIEKD